MKRFLTVPKVLLTAGILLLLAIQIISVDAVYSGWGWNRSAFKHFFWPLLVLAIALCACAPLFTAAPLSNKAVKATLFALLAVAIYFATSLVILVLYGS